MQPLLQNLESFVVLAGVNGSCFCNVGLGWNPAPIGFFERLGYAHDVRFAWAASAIAALGILLPAWAWIRHRWQRRGRVAYQCPRCRYDLRGIVHDRTYPLQCSECALDILSEHELTTPRRGWKLTGIALLLFTVAYLTVIWPEVQRDGWTRLVPSTVLVLQPMDVTAWTDVRLGNPYRPPVRPLSPPDALVARLYRGGLWRWQEWLLFKRIERSCRARDNYGITPAQYDMAVTLFTTPADAPDEETLAERMARFAESTGVAFVIDAESLAVDDWHGRDLVQPAPINATVADAMDRLFARYEWAADTCWDITPDGVVVVGYSNAASTTRTRLYDVSLLVGESFGLARLEFLTALEDLVLETIEPDHWVVNGGTSNTLFGIGDHLVVVARARVHFQIERLLDNLAAANEAELDPVPPYRLVAPRQLTVRSEYALGLLDYVRIERTISTQTLRAAGPTFSDGVTAEELNACDRAAFGLLDRLR